MRRVRQVLFAQSKKFFTNTSTIKACANNFFKSPLVQYTALSGVALYMLQREAALAEEKQHVVVSTTEDEQRYILQQNAVYDALRNKPVKDWDIVLYQYQVCPFCCKVRAFLDYNKIPYKIIEVDPVFKGEIKGSNYKKVPQVLVAQGAVQVNDSTLIISTLATLLREQNILPRSANDENEKIWRKWVDHKFVHTIPPNIYRTRDEAVAAFEYISDMNQFSYLQKQASKYLGSSVMYIVSKRLKDKYKIDDERAAIYECGNEWTGEVQARGGEFHGGSKPDLADLAVYGVLTSIEGLQTFEDLCEHTSIGEWYYRMKQTVGACAGTRIN